MQGDEKVIARNKNNYHEFTLHRNITILRGDSGRGKTKLFELVEDYNSFGKSSDAKVISDCLVIAYRGRDWRNDIKKIKSSIVIVDEENSKFINSVDFAKTIKGTSNYYLLISFVYLSMSNTIELIIQFSGFVSNSLAIETKSISFTSLGLLIFSLSKVDESKKSLKHSIAISTVS